MSIALSGNDTVIINGRSFVDFADGDFATLDFPDNIANMKTGKNGNTIVSLNTSGLQAKMVLRLLRGSPDDKYMNTLLTQQRSNLSSFILMAGKFIKKIGDGAGNITSDTYITGGGIFDKQVGAKANAEGDTNQSVVEYALSFSNAPRSLS